MTPSLFLAVAFVFTIINRLYTKYILGKADAFATAIVTNILCAIALLPFIYQDLGLLLTAPLGLYVIMIVLGLLWTYVAWAGNLSIAQNNFSFKEIIRQTRIIWVVLFGVLVFGEMLDVHEIIGVALIICSVFIISFREFSFKEHISSKPIVLAWSVAFFAAAIALLEKAALTYNAFPIALYAAVLYIMPVIFLIPFLTKKRRRAVVETTKSYPVELVLTALFMTVSYFAALSAYQALPISLAYPLIQSSTVVGVLIGTVWFEKSTGLGKKVLASLVAVLGVVLIQLF
jgi:multidrug transporter EmrE-like cation transporter